MEGPASAIDFAGVEFVNTSLNSTALKHVEYGDGKIVMKLIVGNEEQTDEKRVTMLWWQNLNGNVDAEVRRT